MAITLQQIATAIQAELHGDGSVEITAISSMQKALPGSITFLSDSKYSPLLATVEASAVIVKPEDLSACTTNALVMKNPYVGFALVAQLLDTTPAPATDIAPSAVIAADVILGSNVAIGANAVIETGVSLADGVIIGAGSFVGKNTSIGQDSKLWANVTIYHGVTIEDDVFCGPHMTFTNDLYPRAFGDSWEVSKTLVKRGASIGAHAVIVCNTTLGEYCLVASGAVVTKDVPSHGLVMGNPARLVGFVCKCAKTLKDKISIDSNFATMRCSECKTVIMIPIADYQKVG